MRGQTRLRVFLVVSIAMLVLASIVQAQGMRWHGGGGWGPGTAYGRIYDPKTVETVAGEVVKIERFTPMRGMSSGVHLVLKTGTGEVSVHLGPQWYLENQDACSHPDGAARVARAAEAAGFESLWCGEHVVLPDPQAPPSPMAPRDRILDPIVALTWLAAHTERLRLGTGIIIMPQRNPLVLAKELASLDVLSGGRLILGIGVGYLEPEFRAVGANFEQRGAVTDEYVAAMQAIWGQERPAYKGRFAAFSDIQAHPQPLQRGGPPIVVGGRSASAFRRAVTRGHDAGGRAPRGGARRRHRVGVQSRRPTARSDAIDDRRVTPHRGRGGRRREHRGGRGL